MIDENQGILRVYATKEANFARCTEIQGRITGWTRALQKFTSDPIEAATVQEIEEVLYHASAYAGFPAANSARGIAAEVIGKMGG